MSPTTLWYYNRHAQHAWSCVIPPSVLLSLSCPWQRKGRAQTAWERLTTRRSEQHQRPRHLHSSLLMPTYTQTSAYTFGAVFLWSSSGVAAPSPVLTAWELQEMRVQLLIAGKVCNSSSSCLINHFSFSPEREQRTCENVLSTDASKNVVVNSSQKAFFCFKLEENAKNHKNNTHTNALIFNAASWEGSSPPHSSSTLNLEWQY